jgi:predicted LPLAT superfamily acyltransferase
VAWQDTREVGSRWGIRFTMGLMRLVGYRVTRAFVACLALYYAFTMPSARRHIGEFHRRALGRSSRWLAFRSVFAFAESILDRAFAVLGKGRRFQLTVHAPPGLLDGTAPPRGHLVLGAHLGVMEMARAFAQTQHVAFSMLMHDAPSSVLYDEMKRLDPGMGRNVIPVASEAESIAPLLEVRERLEKGEYVGILGDRTWHSGVRVRIPFLGAQRDFPAGPYLLAAALKAPVLLMFLVKTGTRTYALHIERFAEPGDLPTRRDRAAGVDALARRYAARLEEYARRYPTQWYNFYDFWGSTGD